MVYAWIGLLLLVNAAWTALIIVGLPGTWLIVLTTALFAWWDAAAASSRAHAPIIGWMTLAIVAGLAALGELVEFAAGTAGAARAGGTWRGAVGALVGGLIGSVVGSFVIPLLGSLIGACVGAGIGAASMELPVRRTGDAFEVPTADAERALQIGMAAGIGRFWGTIGKLVIAVVMMVVIAVAALSR